MDREHVLARDLKAGVGRRVRVEIDVRLVADRHEPVLAGEREELLVVRARRLRAGRVVRIVVKDN